MLRIKFVESLMFSFWVGRAEVGEAFEYTVWTGLEAGVGVSAAFVQVLELLVGFEVDAEV